MQSDGPSELDIRYIWRVLWHRKWMIAGLVIATAVAVYGYSSSQTKIYGAWSEVQVADVDSASLTEGAGRVDSERILSNEVYRLTSRGVRSLVNDSMGDDAALIQGVSASPVEGTDVIRITVTSTSPRVASEAADAYATIYVDLRREQLVGAYDERAAELRATADQIGEQIDTIEEQLVNPFLPGVEAAVLQAQRTALGQQQNDLQQRATELDLGSSLRSRSVGVVEESVVPGTSLSPTPRRDTVLAAVVMLVLAVGFAFLLQRLDDRVNTPDQIAAATGGVPVLGVIPLHGQSRWLRRRGLPRRQRALVSLHGGEAEAFRALQTSLRFLTMGQEKRVIAVTSTAGSEGKTTVTANLAMMLVESGQRVLLISADLRRPQLSSMFGVDDLEKGLTSVMLGDELLADSLVTVTLPSGKTLQLLPSGPLPSSPAELLGSPQFGAMLDRVEAASADFVLIDCPPVLPVSDPLAIAQHVDGVIMVAVAGYTKIHDLEVTTQRLRQVGAELVGLVLNGLSPKAGPYAYGYGYGYGYGQERDHKSWLRRGRSSSPEPSSTSRASATPEDEPGGAATEADRAAEELSSGSPA